MALDLSQASRVMPLVAPVTRSDDAAPAPLSRARIAGLFAPSAAQTKRLDPLSGAGVRLTTYVLVILSTVVALFIGVLVYQEKQFRDMAGADPFLAPIAAVSVAGAPPSVEQLKARQEILKTYQDMANASREFWAKMAQMILLNLLLPVLTALLGYVFASKPANR